MKFKDFISEASVSQSPNYHITSVEKAVEFINQKCKDSFWMLKENSPIYRAERDFPYSSTQKIATVDTSETERRSQNTSNFYTVILDNHPEMKDFPKRSRSFIASTNESVAQGFGNGSKNNFMIIPSDNAKIGVVHGGDIWLVHFKLFDTLGDIQHHNSLWRSLKFDAKSFYEDLISFDKKLKDDDEESISKLQNAEKEYGYKLLKYKDSFLEEVWRAYSPKSTGLTWHYSSNLPKNIDSEVWISGEIVMINESMWNSVLRFWQLSNHKVNQES